MRFLTWIASIIHAPLVGSIFSLVLVFIVGIKGTSPSEDNHSVESPGTFIECVYCTREIKINNHKKFYFLRHFLVCFWRFVLWFMSGKWYFELLPLHIFLIFESFFRKFCNSFKVQRVWNWTNLILWYILQCKRGKSRQHFNI